jgi:tRNA pseudouridine55 synthase
MLLPVEALVASMPRLEVDAEEARALMQGRTVVAPAAPSGRYRGFGPKGFVGTVDVVEGLIRPLRMTRTE